MDRFSVARKTMVEKQLKQRGITSPLVLDAMLKVPRHHFISTDARLDPLLAYDDRTLSIGAGQTISLPYVVALMSELLDARPGMSVLEIGTGCGYQTAVLCEMGLHVYSVERLRELYNSASKRLGEMRYYRLRLKLADGTQGWPDSAPFDRIIVTAGGPDIPVPLVEQLADPGIMVIPVGGERQNQELVTVQKLNGTVTTQRKGGVRFVDLVGDHGW